MIPWSQQSARLDTELETSISHPGNDAIETSVDRLREAQQAGAACSGRGGIDSSYSSGADWDRNTHMCSQDL